MSNLKQDSLDYHAQGRPGKLKITATKPMDTQRDLSLAYSPGVAYPVLAIADQPELAYDYTAKGNLVAVISNGTAILGLGDRGPLAAKPVMEGKAVLFKRFADVDAFPIALSTTDPEEIIRTIKNIAPVFGGINLEDISAPRCFEIEERLQNELGIPVFHDDQHGTAVVVLAGLLNAVKIVGKKLEDLKVVVNGFGAGGVACTRMLLQAGVKNIVPCDRTGVVYRGRPEGMNAVKEAVIKTTNPNNEKGTLADALRGADVFLGVSVPGTVTPEMIHHMAADAIVFALANPIPEILPDEIEGTVRIIATGRSDYANQVNNVLCFPGMFKGALASGATRITSNMKIAAARGIASMVSDSQLSEKHIIPTVFEGDVAGRVAELVAQAAVEDGVTRRAS